MSGPPGHRPPARRSVPWGLRRFDLPLQREVSALIARPPVRRPTPPVLCPQRARGTVRHGPPLSSRTGFMLTCSSTRVNPGNPVFDRWTGDICGEGEGRNVDAIPARVTRHRTPSENPCPGPHGVSRMSTRVTCVIMTLDRCRPRRTDARWLWPRNEHGGGERNARSFSAPVRDGRTRDDGGVVTT
jgi:hypothetical protein